MASGGIDEAILAGLPSPCYVVDERALDANARCLAAIQERTGARILLALKAFAMHSTFHVLKPHLHGTCASGLHEARLGKETFGGEVHVYAPAYQVSDFDAILQLASHVTFNSVHQWDQFKGAIHAAPARVSCGLRINPGYSEITIPLYDPCRPLSRLGIPGGILDAVPDGIEGLHFHCLCEQGAGTLERVVSVMEGTFGHLLPSIKWLNLGGGHLITKPDYDIDKLCNIITRLKEEYGVDVYLEPGEAVASNAGIFITTVLDIVPGLGLDLAILDASAATHMPDVLEMPYRPDIVGAGTMDEHPFKYQLGGCSCLAGDVFGDYSFETRLARGDRLVFTDMAHYSMVKNNTFNGIPLPALAVIDREGRARTIKRFGYEEFKGRLS